MLQKVSSQGKLVKLTFQVKVEIDPARIDPAQVGMKLADSLSWVEGTGDVIIEDITEGEE